jgi:carnitine-CoA ligase
MPALLPLTELTFARVLAHHIARRGDKPFLRELASQRTWSFAAFGAWTDRVANALATLGVGPGTHVGLLMGNSAEHLATFMALAKRGAVAVPVNTAARGDLLRYYLEHADVQLLVVDEELAPRVAQLEPAPAFLRRLVLVGPHGASADVMTAGLPQGCVDWSTCVSQAGPQPVESPARFTSLLLLAYTSGTTGPSKASMLSQAAALTYAMGGIEAHGYRPDDVFYVCLPLFHVNALLTSTATALVCGGSVALAERFSAARFFEEIRDCGATTTNLLGAMSSFLWSRPAQTEDRSHALRLVSMSPLPAYTRAFEDRFGLRAVTNYGLSDFATVTSWRVDSPTSKLGSIGTPRSFFEVAVLDDDDLACAPGTIGEIALRTREPWRAATGYYKMPEVTTTAYRNQWFHTGDRGWRDADGYFWFVDRKKDCIRRRGENVSSFEVEQVLARHHAVGAIAVFPVRTADGDEEVGAAVVLREGCSVTERELVEHCSGNMSYFMVPRYLRFVPGLPTTMNQKVEKFRLQENFEKDLNAVWDRERAGIVLAR